MPKFTSDITDLSNLPATCRKLLEFAGGIKVIVFSAEMGAGKTTFIKALCSFLGSQDNFSSPTYSIVNEYLYKGGKIFHFDLYRVRSAGELFDFGFEEYIDSGNYCFIEWPEMAFPYITSPYLSVTINHSQNNRYLSAQIIK